MEETTQCFVTSHSPYAIERFDPSQIIILRRNGEAKVDSTTVASGTTLKGKMYKRHARRGLAEAKHWCGHAATVLRDDQVWGSDCTRLPLCEQPLYQLAQAVNHLASIEQDAELF
ncbi:hypothetical protein J3D54_005306 [Pseudomonas sp. GGS8]|uniref:hypothetical protein n=1 Tax=Pseudomonas sp. GGS8 TaxID=2817892 RepID=UPI00209CA1B5|nr:hypothetical protein [Pseudomonas sp. GGS8]MCP1446174.1 hypothetical protein [Pseudomonas sp. GGS8]